jgi:hypothetical protein
VERVVWGRFLKVLSHILKEKKRKAQEAEVHLDFLAPNYA